jgi:3,4-dihydroxy 2-butanone 4-phosphate synthase/GTP cyclohydrolase II
MAPDGTIAGLSHLQELADQGDYPLLSVQDLVRYCRSEKNLVENVADASIPTQFGTFQAIAYRSTLRDREHVVLTYGEPRRSETPIVRLHSQCITGDVFGSRRCDCGEQLHESMRMIAEEGEGIVLYLTQEGRGIGLANKIKAYELQEKGMDTVEANSALGFDPDPRDYGIGAEILRDLGLEKLRLLTNNPQKISELNEYGLDVVERIPLEVCPNEQNRDYLETKRDKMGHMFQELKQSAS